MALSIGTLIGYLELDDAGFERKAERADRTMEALKLHLRALAAERPDIKLKVNAETYKVTVLQDQLHRLQADAAKGLDVRVDMVRTLMQMDAIRAKIRELQASTAEENAELDDTIVKVGLLRRAADGLGGVKGPSILMTAIVGLLPLLVTVGGAGAAGFIAMAGAAMSAAAAVGVLKLGLSGIGASVSAYKAYQSAMANATTAKQRAAAQAALGKSAYGQQGATGQQFSRFIANTFASKSGKFDVKGAAQDAMLPGIESGLKAIIPLAPVAKKVVGQIGGAIGNMADKAGHALAKPFWKQWFTWLGTFAAKDVHLIGDALGHILDGLAHALQKGSTHDFTKWLDNLAKRFDKWTQGKGFTKFLDTVNKDGRAVVGVLKAAAPALLPILSGLNSGGSAEAQVLASVLTTISALPPVVFKVLATTLPFIVLGMKGLEIANTVAGWIKKAAVAMGIMDAAMDANPIGLVVLAIGALVIGFTEAYAHSAKFRAIVNGALHAVGEAGTWLWDKALKPAFKWIISGFLDLAGAIIHGAADAFGWVPGIGPKLKGAAAEFDKFKTQVNNSLNGIVPARTVVISMKVARVVAASQAAHPQGHMAPLGHNALGTLDWGGGWSVVGENGPELVNMPAHSRVVPSAQSKALLGGHGRSVGAMVRQPVHLILETGQSLRGYVQGVAENTVLNHMEYAGGN